MDDKEKIQAIADKWGKLTHIGGQIKSGSSIDAKVSSCTDRLSHRQMDILSMLECMDINTISEMANYLKISKSTLSIVMNKLVKKGYVIKEYPVGGDGRRVYFKISPEGHRIFERLGKYYIEGLAAFYMRFSDRGRELFKEGVACLKRTVATSKTPFGLMATQDKYVARYGEDLCRVAEDIAFFFVNCRVNNPIEGEVPDDRLTQNQFHLILCIMTGLDSLTKLERHLGSSGSTISISVSKLVERGYLYKEYPGAGQDGRMVYIRVTDKGKGIVERFGRDMNNKFVAYLEKLDDESLELFGRGCDCLLKAFETL